MFAFVVLTCVVGILVCQMVAFPSQSAGAALSVKEWKLFWWIVSVESQQALWLWLPSVLQSVRCRTKRQ